MSIQTRIQERILLPYAPEIPGLIFRGFRGEADYQVMLDLINASKGPDDIDRTDTLEDIARNYAHLNNCDPYQDMLFVEVDDHPAAYGRVEWNIDWKGNWVGFQLAFSDPDFRRMGIGTTMLRYFEEHLRQIANHQLVEGVIKEHTRRYFESFFADTEVGKEALFRNAGYSPARFSYSMVRPLNEPVEITPMPDGIEIRKVQPTQYRQLWEADQYLTMQRARQARVRPELQRDGVGQRSGKAKGGLGHDGAEVDRGNDEVRLAGVGEDLAGQLRRHEHGFFHLLEVVPKG